MIGFPLLFRDLHRAYISQLVQFAMCFTTVFRFQFNYLSITSLLLIMRLNLKVKSILLIVGMVCLENET